MSLRTDHRAESMPATDKGLPPAIGVLKGLIWLLLIAFTLTACNSSDRTTVVSGYAINGPLNGATVEVLGPNGPLGFAVTDSDGHFSVEIAARPPYRLRVSGGTLDGIPYEGVLEASCEAAACDATPWSTLVVRLMEELGFNTGDALALLVPVAGFDYDPFTYERHTGEPVPTQAFELQMVRAFLDYGAGVEDWVGDIVSWLSGGECRIPENLGIPGAPGCGGPPPGEEPAASAPPGDPDGQGANLLNGVALYREGGQDQYLGALYTDTLSTDRDRLRRSDGSMRMEIKIVASSGLSASDFIRHWIEGIALNNPFATLERHADTMIDFLGHFAGTFVSGDHIVFTAVRQEGMHIHLNGEHLGTLQDSGLFDVLLGTWIGPAPVDLRFRDDILRGGNAEPGLQQRFDQLPANPASGGGRQNSVAPMSREHLLAHRRYYFDLYSAIRQQASYPRRAVQRGIEGTVRISIVIGRDGRIIDASIPDMTGNQMLISEAWRAAQRATGHFNSYTPLPPEFTGDRFECSVPVHFILQR